MRAPSHPARVVVGWACPKLEALDPGKSGTAFALVRALGANVFIFSAPGFAIGFVLLLDARGMAARDPILPLTPISFESEHGAAGSTIAAVTIVGMVFTPTTARLVIVLGRLVCPDRSLTGIPVLAPALEFLEYTAIGVNVKSVSATVACVIFSAPLIALKFIFQRGFLEGFAIGASVPVLAAAGPAAQGRKPFAAVAFGGAPAAIPLGPAPFPAGGFVLFGFVLVIA